MTIEPDTGGTDTIFHGYFRSSAAYRCRIAFNLKGFAPAQRFVHLRKGGLNHSAGGIVWNDVACLASV